MSENLRNTVLAKKDTWGTVPVTAHTGTCWKSTRDLYCPSLSWDRAKQLMLIQTEASPYQEKCRRLF